MLRVAVCDDCSLQTGVISELLNKYMRTRPGVKILTENFSSGDGLLSHIEAGQAFDLYLLDILMPGKSGIEFARALRELDPDVPIVFMTSSKDYALEAFEVSAVQYLLKPVTAGKLFPVLDKLPALRVTREEPLFVLTTRGKIVNIPLVSILYVELVGRALAVNLTDSKKITGTSIRMPFAQAVAPLLSDTRFFHVHKSFVINLDHVRALDRAHFILNNGEQIPISKQKYAEAKAAFLARTSGAV